MSHVDDMLQCIYIRQQCQALGHEELANRMDREGLAVAERQARVNKLEADLRTLDRAVAAVNARHSGTNPPTNRQPATSTGNVSMESAIAKVNARRNPK